MMFLNGFPDFYRHLVASCFGQVTLGLFPLSRALTPYAGLSRPGNALKRCSMASSALAMPGNR